MTELERRLPVYVIHWNSPEWCVSAVDSLRRSVGVVVEVTVVDNGSSGGHALREALPAEVRVLPTAENLGYTGAANVAIGDWLGSPAPAPYAVIASHDLHVEPGALATLFDAAAQNPSVGVLGPAIGFLGFFRPGRKRLAPLPSSPGLHDCDWVVGTCLFIRRECALAVGDFDASFGSYCEDVDYCLRAKDHGWRVCVHTEARAHGLGSADPATAALLIQVNGIRLARKREGIRGWLVESSRVARVGLRSGGGAVAPWRSTDARIESRSRARACVRALTRGLILLRGQN